MDKVLRINVLVDEDGQAERKLDAVDQKIDHLGTASEKTTRPLDRLTGSLKDSGDEADDLALATKGASFEFDKSIPIIGGMTTKMALATAGTAALALGIIGVGLAVKESISYYLEQSNVLAVNEKAVDRVDAAWGRLKYTIGQVIVGTDGDVSGWLNLVSVGLDVMTVKLTTGIAFWRELVANLPLGQTLNLVNEYVDHRFGDDPTGGGDTRYRDASGQPTDYAKARIAAAAGELQLLTRSHADYGQMVNRVMPDAIEWLEAYHEAIEQSRLELAAFFDMQRQAFDNELADAFVGNLDAIRGATRDLRDEFAALVLSKDQLKQFEIHQDTDRAIAGIDPRVENAEQAIAALEARRQGQLLALRADSEGLSEALRQDILVFRETYADVLGGLPSEMQSIVPETVATSAEIREAFTGAFADVEATASRTFESIVIQAKTAQQLLQEAAMMEYDAERNQQAGDPLGIGWWQRIAAADRRRQAGQAGYRESVVGWSRGGIVPDDGVLYARDGAFVPRGTDTVPAMLTPGEGVINRAGMAALEKINSGVVGGLTITGPLVDARGASFQDEAAITRLADRVQQKIAELAIRVGG